MTGPQIHRKRRWPQKLIGHSFLPKLGGHTATTVFFWVFVAGVTISPELLIHEYRHTEQQIAATVIGFALLAAAALLGLLSPWWMLASPLTFFVAYFPLCLGGYRRNPFEVDARRWAAAHWREYFS